jgi:hypothetical protein
VAVLEVLSHVWSLWNEDDAGADWLKTVSYNCTVPYILESNAHPVFGDFLNEKKLVCDSNAHLSFNHTLPTGRLIE